ncbi:MAG TPA: metallophosphoesterase [bacterium]|nr:metallophosphoesterase [bacterium]HPN29574.1 metallophosphoesterase [bacterium]
MKLGIMSDSHDNMPLIEKTIDLFNKEKVDLSIHCGDIISPITCRYFIKSNSKIIFVFGNNDGERIILKEKIFQMNHSIFQGPYEFEFDSKNFLMMHEPAAIDSFKNSSFYSAVFFGHTHKLEIVKSKTLIINPGEICGYVTGKQTAVILETTDMSYKIFDVNNFL